MKPLFTDDELNTAKIGDKLSCECYTCQSIFFVEKRQIISHLNGGKDKCMFCSQKCNTSMQTKIEVHCINCGNKFTKIPSQILRTKNNFCSKSCAATYNNTHKKHGTRVSKLEKWLESKLTILYPTIEFNFNHKDAINSELDIYIPSLKLAFELNGIFHYEPIFGSDKLNQIQNNDNRKFQACIEQDIELCIIDTSMQKYFKEQTSIKFLNIIQKIINIKCGESGIRTHAPVTA